MQVAWYECNADVHLSVANPQSRLMCRALGKARLVQKLAMRCVGGARDE